MKKNIVFLSISILLTLAGCAGVYTSIVPERVNYVKSQQDGEVVLNYKYDLLSENGNKKYAKKEAKKNIKLVVVEIKNNTNETLTFGQSVKLLSGDQEIRPLAPEITHSLLKQSAPVHALYLLLTPMTLTTGGDDVPVGYVVGPGIAAINIITAANSNKKLKEDLITYDLMNQPINAGQTVYGIFGLRDNNFAPLSVKVTR